VFYRFLRDSGHGEEPPWLTQELEQDPGPAGIVRGALERRDALCLEAVDLFVSIYGAEAGNLALKIMARGGHWRRIRGAAGCARGEARGDAPMVECLRPIFETLAPGSDRGGRPFQKMIHNGIEHSLRDVALSGILTAIQNRAIGIGERIGSDSMGGQVRTRHHVRVRLFCQGDARPGRPRALAPPSRTLLMMATLPPGHSRGAARRPHPWRWIYGPL
jgi:hypothetical protein